MALSKLEKQFTTDILGVKGFVSACLGIVGGEVGNYWRKRGTCGAIEANIVIVVFPNDLIRLRSNT